MSTGNMPTPKTPVPWVWLIGAVLATTCLVCPCGIGTGWWFGSGRGPAMQIPPPRWPVPTEAMAKKVFENLNKDDLATGYVRLLTVRKTNGVSTDHGGVKGYTMDCKLEFEFLKNWTLEQDPFLFIRAGNKNGKCVKGEKMAIKREVHFEKSEKGWRWGNLVVE